MLGTDDGAGSNALSMGPWPTENHGQGADTAWGCWAQRIDEALSSLLDAFSSPYNPSAKQA